jgi:hypothetical protein
VSIGTNSLYSSTTASSNIAIGYQAMQNVTTVGGQIGIGTNALSNVVSGIGGNIGIGDESLTSTSTGDRNTALGASSLKFNTTGAYNTVIGNDVMRSNTTGGANTALGMKALLLNTTGQHNTAVGMNAGENNTTGVDNIFIGAFSNPATGNLTNAIVIGNSATVSTSNTIQLGNTSITDVKTSGAITAAGFKIAGGTSTQTIMADGSVSSSMVSILNKILFVKFINASRPEVWVANYDGTNSSKVNITLPTGIEFEDGLENLKMSPDGNKIFSPRAGINWHDAKGNKIKTITVAATIIMYG